MIFNITYKFCLRPTRRNLNDFANSAGACRWLFNHGLERKKAAYEQEGKTLSYYDLNNELPSLKRAEETKWLKGVHSQVLQQALKDLDNSFQHFFRRVKLKETPGFPRFKCKGEKDSFRYPQGVKVNGNQVYLPKIGYVKFKKTREIEGVIKETTIILEAGNWYVCFSCEVKKEVPSCQIDEKKAVGIDMGLLQYATLAKGEDNKIEKISNPRFLKKQLSKLRYLSKSLSRKVFRSHNRYKAKLKFQKFQGWLKNCRKDFAHKLSTQVVKSQDIIGVESISIAALLKSSRTALARSIADAGWRQFLEYLKYKAQRYGKVLVEMDRWFASTKTCSHCRQKNELQLSDRICRCHHCSQELDRDENAAINIKNAAIEKFKAAGMSVSKLVELPH